MQLEVDWKISGAMAFKGCFFTSFFLYNPNIFRIFAFSVLIMSVLKLAEYHFEE